MSSNISVEMAVMVFVLSPKAALHACIRMLAYFIKTGGENGIGKSF